MINKQTSLYVDYINHIKFHAFVWYNLINLSEG